MQRVSSLEHKPVKMHEMSINPRGRLSCLTNEGRFFRNVFFLVASFLYEQSGEVDGNTFNLFKPLGK